MRDGRCGELLPCLLPSSCILIVYLHADTARTSCCLESTWKSPAHRRDPVCICYLTVHVNCMPRRQSSPHPSVQRLLKLCLLDVLLKAHGSDYAFWLVVPAKTLMVESLWFTPCNKLVQQRKHPMPKAWRPALLCVHVHGASLVLGSLAWLMPGSARPRVESKYKWVCKAWALDQQRQPARV